MVNKIQISLAFDISNHPESMTKSILSWGKRSRKDVNMLPHALSDPSIEVGYHGKGMEREFYLYKGPKCVGAATFERCEIDAPIKRYFPSGTLVATPHIDLAPEVRGLGIASAIYLMAVKSYVLATDHQSASAAKLWDSVARKSGSVIYYYDEISKKFVDDPDQGNTWKVLTKVKPRGIK